MKLRQLIVALFALSIATAFNQSVYPMKTPQVSLAELLQEMGYPGIVPSPDLLERYQALGLAPPRVADWAAPFPDRAVTGTRTILVIRIDFPDKAGIKSQSYYQDLIFGTSQGQMKHYYAEVSYGLLTITGSVTANWIRSTRNMIWWGTDNPPGIDNQNADIFELAREAVILADASVDFAPYDVNSNGVIDPSELSMCIVHAGNGQESSGSSTDIWSHRWYIFGQGYVSRGVPLSDTFVDGKRISKHPDDYVGGYFMQAETSPLGTFAHEFGHDLGLPDLYDTDYSSDGIGMWGLMSYGSWLGSPSGSSPAHPIGWSKAKLGWITPVAISSGNSIPVKQIETFQSQSLYKLAISSTEYFLIENRQKTGYDSYLPGSGILIWHVDDSKISNANDADRWVDLEEAHGGIQHLDAYSDGNNGDANDPFYSPQKTSFADGTDPNSKTKAGAFSGIVVTNIGALGMTMTVNFGTRIIRMYSLSVSYLGQDPESVKSSDIGASISVNYFYQGQSQSKTSSTYFDVTADVGSSISFTVTSTPSGWSFASKWDHYGYSQHDATTLTITVVSGSGIDKVAAFFTGLQIQITVTSSPTGSGFVIVDGTPTTTPQTFTWIQGSTHTLSATSPVSGGTGIQYVWVSWSDGGTQSHTITVPSSATTYTANFKRQYMLTVSVSPAGGGSLSVTSGWQDDGTTVQVTATANPGYSFHYWSLDGVNVGSGPSYSVLMNSAHSLTALFRGISSISLGLSAGSIALGASVTLSGTITPAQPSPGIPVGTAVVLSFSLDGTTWSDFMMTLTGSGGAYSALWYPPYPATYQIRATWNGNADYVGSTSSAASLTVTGTSPPRITLLVSGPASTARGSTATFDVLVTNPGPYISTTLYFEVVGPGGYWYFDTQQVSVSAGGAGRFQFVWRVPWALGTGQYQVLVGLIPPRDTSVGQTQITVT